MCADDLSRPIRSGTNVIGNQKNKLFRAQISQPGNPVSAETRKAGYSDDNISPSGSPSSAGIKNPVISDVPAGLFRPKTSPEARKNEFPLTTPAAPGQKCHRKSQTS
jgi:hypothetical protein